MTRWASVFAFCVIATVALLGGGCGGDDASDQRVAADLQSRVQAVRTAVVTGDTADAERLLNDLEGHVTQLLDQGALDGRQAARILSAARALQGQLASITTTTTPPPPPPEDDHDDDGDD